VSIPFWIDVSPRCLDALGLVFYCSGARRPGYGGLVCDISLILGNCVRLIIQLVGRGFWLDTGGPHTELAGIRAGPLFGQPSTGSFFCRKVFARAFDLGIVLCLFAGLSRGHFAWTASPRHPPLWRSGRVGGFLDSFIFEGGCCRALFFRPGAPGLPTPCVPRGDCGVCPRLVGNRRGSLGVLPQVPLYQGACSRASC